MPSLDVDDGNLIASGIYGKQSRLVVFEDQRPLRASIDRAKSRQAAQATDGGRAAQGQRAIFLPVKDGDRVRAAQVVIQDIHMPIGALLGRSQGPWTRSEQQS